MESNTENLYVVYSSDNNYAQHMGVSIYSLLDTNKSFKHIFVYIIDNQICTENKEKLEKLVGSFSNASIEWVGFDQWMKKLDLNMAWNISISAYARLFISTMLSDKIDRILYLDCDTIICDSVKDFWEMDLQSNVIGVVQDTVNKKIKNAVGLVENERYFNSGVLLIDLKLWRTEKIEEKCLKFIAEHEGKVCHHDQGVLNGILSKESFFVPLEYNVMTIHYIFNRRQLMKYYKEEAVFYSDEEISNAKKKPVILHYTPSFTARPWVRGCSHPLKEKYWNILLHTPWRTAKKEKNSAKWYVRCIEWRYRNLPF